MVFGCALGVAPTELIGKGVQVATRAGTTGAIRNHRKGLGLSESSPKSWDSDLRKVIMASWVAVSRKSVGDLKTPFQESWKSA